MTEKRVVEKSIEDIQESSNLDKLATKIRREALLPIKSFVRYEEAWTQFLQWKDSKYPDTPMDENALIVYLDALKERFAPSSLWTVFSMLKRQFMVSFLFIFFYLSYVLLTNSINRSTIKLPHFLLPSLS
jgi:hypothetical protein